MEMDNIYTKKEIKLPVIPMRGIWIFPHTVIHFDVGRELSLNALNEAMVHDSLVFFCFLKDPIIENPTVDEFYDTGIVAEI